ncbi:MAG: 3'(2'),5'-bisphosphate nucleotidase CysQ [Betaproteobacteria bacterium]
MTDPNFANLLPSLKAIAREAGRAILDCYERSDCASDTKADGTPVTAADHAAEAIILPALHRLAPEIPAISEERHAAGGSPELRHGTFWLIDPLDGTRSYVERTGEFTVNIGLIRDGVPVLGVIYAPVTDDLYAAAGPGTAVHAARGTEETTISARLPPPEGLTVLASRSHGSREKLEHYLAGERLFDQRLCSSSLKFCFLAAGLADIYPRFGPTCEWDTAAGHAILLAAGGSILTPDGRPLAYAKPEFLNPDFIAFGRRTQA